jgi:hypothetical protein
MDLRARLRLLILLPLALLAVAGAPESTDTSGADPARGLAILLEQPLSFPALTVAELERLWTVWQGEERAQAAAADLRERRRLVFARYGLTPRPAGLGRQEHATLPLGYTADVEGNLYPNCLACHAGEVAGNVILGLANTRQDLTGLVGDLAALRAHDAGRDPNAARESATAGFPLNFSRGLTNATMYSILLGAMRDQHLDLVPPVLSQPLVNHDVDAPAWWLYAKKERIYWDGMAPKTTRTLMQFAMAPGIKGKTIRGWEDEFRHIAAYISSLEAPAYPHPVDQALAQRGRTAFERTCSRCHGTYEGPAQSYPSKIVPIDEVQTDPVRLGAIQESSKRHYNQSWFSDYGAHPVLLDPGGYMAPPLDGVWASAPYFHNGSVPTLWHVLHPAERPAAWRVALPGQLDVERVGLSIEEVPASSLGATTSREIYVTSDFGHSAQGHPFPSLLSAEERRAVLEYLKTL